LGDLKVSEFQNKIDYYLIYLKQNKKSQMEKIILTLGLVALLSGAAYLLNEKPADVKLAGINSEVVELFTWWKAANGKKYGSLD